MIRFHCNGGIFKINLKDINKMPGKDLKNEFTKLEIRLNQNQPIMRFWATSFISLLLSGIIFLLLYFINKNEEIEMKIIVSIILYVII